MTQFKRAILTGTLTTQTNFHLGSGQESPNGKEEKESDDGSNDPGSINELCLDANNSPYIPASSLRGYLRGVISNESGLQEIENKLFGMARQKRGAEESGNSGIVRIYDARWKSTDYTKNLISRTSIDPVTGTAKHHHLSTHAIVPPQSIFKVVIEFDDANEDQINTLLQALKTLSPENRGKLGKGKSTGQGEMHWQQSSLKVLKEEKLKSWLNQSSIKPNNKGWQSNKATIEKKLEQFFIDYTISGEIKPFTSSLSNIKIYLKANSPILVNDPHAVKHREQENENKKEASTPDCIYMKRKGSAIIPGSTLKGWVRARCRRILLSISENSNETIADTMLEEIFGHTNQQSTLYFDDAEVEVNEDKHLHKQTFNAIDRFTGGVKPHALYNVEAIWPDDTFITHIHYQKEKLKGWMKLLLLYVIRDSMEGDLVLGWGKSKGYGRLTLSTDRHENWDKQYQAINQNDLTAWNHELEQKLQGEKNEIS